ncbi:hypothetical protein MXD81_62805 [Microbacteriaceae bacterium K1510]|nr:hypothetical protein [Microbacteriaceae bacterium K1510]
MIGLASLTIPMVPAAIDTATRMVGAVAVPGQSPHAVTPSDAQSNPRRSAPTPAASTPGSGGTSYHIDPGDVLVLDPRSSTSP